MSDQGLPLSAAHGLETGMWAALGRATSGSLLRAVPPHDLTLFCWTALVLAKGLPDVFLVRRVSRIFVRAFYSIAVRASLQSAVMPGDTGLTLANLLSLYLLASTVHQDSFEGSAQYHLVSCVAQCLRTLGGAALPAATLAASLPPAALHPSFHELSRLVMVDVFMGALMAALPPTQVFLAVVLLLYLTFPFAALCPPLLNLYAYAVYAATTDAQLRSLPLWELAYALALVWRFSPDPVSARVASVAGGSVLVQLLLSWLQPAMQNDPFLVLLAVLMAIDILGAVETSSARTGRAR
jgi:hypothetical protein